MIGLYDSGLGGLSVLAALRAAGVTQDVLYFADQAHVPYGGRTDADLQALLTENFSLLAGHGVAAIVMACNTSCAVAARSGGFPPAPFPVFDLIANAGERFTGARFARVAVFATAATVRSGAYGRMLRARLGAVEVLEVAAPALVPLVERGASGTPEARAAVEELCRALPSGVDAVVYGCTHYPLLDAEFRAALGPAMTIVDPAVTQAAATRRWIATARLAAGTGRTHYLTSGDLAAFERGVRAIAGDGPATFATAALPALS